MPSNNNDNDTNKKEMKIPSLSQISLKFIKLPIYIEEERWVEFGIKIDTASVLISNIEIAFFSLALSLLFVLLLLLLFHLQKNCWKLIPVAFRYVYTI